MEKLNSLKFGIAGGIVGILLILFITISGALGYSEAYTFLTSTIWGSLGYSLTIIGAIIGLVIGFIDGFLMSFIFAWVYNKIL